MTRLPALFLVLFAALIFSASAVRADSCPLERPIMFGGLDWDSNAFHTEVARIVLEEGYGCRTDVLPGSSLPLLTGLGRGDIDVLMEVWLDNVTEPWNEALARGDVVSLGTNFPDAVQGWYVPRYLVEGDAARGIEAVAPGLSHVRDLARYKTLFRDPEEPAKGRFYNCILGWSCEVLNTAKLRAYGLEDDFTNFRPGTGAALAAAIAGAYERGEPVVAYYWGPTWVLGAFDLMRLEEPPYEPAKWRAFADDPANNPPTAYPTVEVVVGANADFAEGAPRIAEFLKAYETSNALTSEALAYLRANPGARARDAARNFLERHPEIWKAWVTPEIAARIEGKARMPESSFPEFLELSLDEPINAATRALVRNYGGFFEAVSTGLLAIILAVETALKALPWWLVLLLAAATGYHAMRHWAAPPLFAGLFFLVGILGLWDLAMQTLALTAVSVFFAVLIGLPAGIGLARSHRARIIARPILDAMQTLPSFVYLIPALMLFGLGKVPALFATLIYATPPLIRLTELGLRLVEDRFTEVAADLGATRWQRLWDIELPLALPNIMAGINQTIMMALSMVVIASMIGARGLGEEVLLGIQRLDVGRGLVAGLAIVLLAIVFDRITQAYGKRAEHR
ncbi:substrate-binding region of ABC-type glycine betaine transport system [Tepidicaulis marinus]|uniref:Substrate-binding region of ABC-type glycine betaine transport system n=2 Tax=Tepidicaulis marinus TaxID=1333998 RepID=A0A081BAZ5_9HYPH|nr:substrate-binding region of ABC-type glycine betaine transport system [Tepidicaulis marinus]